MGNAQRFSSLPGHWAPDGTTNEKKKPERATRRWQSCRRSAVASSSDTSADQGANSLSWRGREDTSPSRGEDARMAELRSRRALRSLRLGGDAPAPRAAEQQESRAGRSSVCSNRLRASSATSRSLRFSLPLHFSTSGRVLALLVHLRMMPSHSFFSGGVYLTRQLWPPLPKVFSPLLAGGVRRRQRLRSAFKLKPCPR